PKYDQKHPYYLGFFLLGAYQEILGNRHNLFSNTSVIDIKLHESGHFDLTIGQCHATISEVLAELKYNNLDLIDNYQQLLHQQILNPTEVDFYLRELKDLLMQSTYLAIRD
ncbi:MAG: biosynthetic arginine decarboxylase, partial [Chitinophagia bacterium]|nr:biosynthetic arginine decarboxylase [Chitinophagia bacterium]